MKFEPKFIGPFLTTVTIILALCFGAVIFSTPAVSPVAHKNTAVQNLSATTPQPAKSAVVIPTPSNIFDAPKVSGSADVANSTLTDAVASYYFTQAHDRQQKWLAKQLQQSGIVIPANVTIMFNDGLENCGDQISPEGAGGGCTYHWHDGTVSVLLSASVPTDKYGAHVLFHELGHALYALNECGAEYFAHNYDHTPTVWSYISCIPAK